jgi:hypothetical protein
MRLAEGRGSNRSEESENRIPEFLTRLESLEKRLDERGPASGAPVPPQPNRQSEISLQIDAMEQRLRRELSRRQEERLSAFGNSLQQRMGERLTPIEAEMVSQRAAVSELRECSMRTEKSLQKLLEGIDRLVDAQTLPLGTGR